MKMKKHQILLLFFGVFLVAGVLYFLHAPSQNEGYANVVATTATTATTAATAATAATATKAAQIPTAAQTSAIPKDTPGATTADPTIALAQPKDIEALMESYKNFYLLAQQKNPLTTDLPQEAKQALYDLYIKYDLNNNEMLATLAEIDKQKVPLSTITKSRQDIEMLTNTLRSARVVTQGAGTQVLPTIKKPTGMNDAEYAELVQAEPMPSVAAPPVGKITMKDLDDLMVRINAEILRLSNLRSTAATTTSRIQQLQKLGADLGDLISSVKRGTMKLEDIPITPDSAAAFLKDIGPGKDKGPLQPLMAPRGALSPSLNAGKSQAAFAGTPANEAAVEKLLGAARNLKWSVNVRLEYDPYVKHREAMMNRIDSIVQNLSRMAVAKSALDQKTHDQYLKELSAIQHQISAQTPQSALGPEGTMARTRTQYSRDNAASAAPQPAIDNLLAAQGAGLGTSPSMFPHGEISPDVYSRPGFVMNDDQIRHRPSTASFDPSVVGGPDYKARSLELCRQIKSAQLGDTKSFGCIANPDEVSADYSWKGNFLMVCNRLGDSWGRAYPEQFGCPKYDPTAKFQSNF